MKIQFSVGYSAHLTYGQGPVGSSRLLKALASFFSSHFHPITPVAQDELRITSGVAALIDTLTWCICDDFEGDLIPQLLYVNLRLISRCEAVGNRYLFLSSNPIVSIRSTMPSSRKRTEETLSVLSNQIWRKASKFAQ